VIWRRLASSGSIRAKVVRASQRAGIPLRQIKEALDQLPSGRTPTREDWARLSARWRQDIDNRISQLRSLRDKLTGCIGCGCLSLQLCQLMNPDDILAETGPGAHNL
jgi:MerR family redox-sensitive transcriptional activator SoxR